MANVYKALSKEIGKYNIHPDPRKWPISFCCRQATMQAADGF
jgi:hypothetical protein